MFFIITRVHIVAPDIHYPPVDAHDLAVTVHHAIVLQASPEVEMVANGSIDLVIGNPPGFLGEPLHNSSDAELDTRDGGLIIPVFASAGGFSGKYDVHAFEVGVGLLFF